MGRIKLLTGIDLKQNKTNKKTKTAPGVLVCTLLEEAAQIYRI